MDEKAIRIRDLKAEILLAKTFCKSKKSIRLFALDVVDESLFGSKLGKFAWQRVKILHHNKKLPRKGGWEALLLDPVVHNQKHAYDILKTMDDLEVSATQDYLEDILGKLSFYRNKRKAFNAIHEAYDKLAKSDDKEEVYGALTPISNTISEVKDFSTAECFTRVDQIDVAERLRQIKEEQKEKSILPTSWWQFDAVNSGLSKGSLLVVAGTTGGGKSAIIGINLLYNFAFQGHRVANTSLEMPEEQNIERIAAFYSDVPLHKIRSYSNLSERDLQKIRDKSKYIENLIESAGGSYWLFTPDKEYEIDDILELAYAKDPEVILVDYINLVKRNPKLDTKDALEEIARKSKNFAKTRNVLVILLAQLGADERVKYSKAVEEHADNVWIWDYKYDNRPGYIHVRQTKARNQLVYPFYLVEDFSSMRVYDILDTMGLNVLFSKARGSSYKEINDALEVERNIEVPGSSILFNRHNFKENVDWEAIQRRAAGIPVPDATDNGAILDLVQEALKRITAYEPGVAQFLLENIQEDNLLKPFKEHVDQMHLPVDINETEGDKFQDITEADDEVEVEVHNETKKNQEIQEDKDNLDAVFAEKIDDTGIDADKLSDTLLNDDNVTSRKDAYNDIFDRKKGVKKKKKNTPKQQKSWEDIKAVENQRKEDKEAGKLFDGVIEMDNPFDILETESDEEKEGLYFAKQDTKPYTDYWKKLERNTPPTTDTIRIHIENEGGPPPVAFLSSVLPEYIDKFESRLNLLDSVYTTKARRIVERLNAEIYQFFSDKSNLNSWLVGYKNEEDERTWVDAQIKGITHTLHTDKESAIVDLKQPLSIKPELLDKIESSIPKTYCNKLHKSVKIPQAFEKLLSSMAGSSIADGETVNRVEMVSLLKQGANRFLKEKHTLEKVDSISQSPFISLFERPEYIESITWDNKESLLKPEMLLSVVKLSVLSQIKAEYDKGLYKTLNSVVWALINRDNRSNGQLLHFVKNTVENTLKAVSHNNKTAMYNRNVQP